MAFNQHKEVGLNGLIRSISEKQQVKEPFYILDLAVVESLVDQWKTHLPIIQPFYAFKCNPNPTFVATLAAQGVNFDCASKGEIEAVLAQGIPANRIVYANACKTESHIKYAASVGVNLTTFDSLEEVVKVKRCHPKCSLLIRIKPPSEHGTWRPLSMKFGALPEEIPELLQCAHDAGLTVAGISFHVGSNATKPEVYHDAIAAARAVFDTAKRLKLPPMYVLNIGGGFKAGPIFEEVATTIRNAINECFSDMASLMVIAEPGRFFVETAFTLVTNVIGKRVRGNVMEYWIDDGIYGSFNLPVYDRSSMMVTQLIKKSDGDDLIYSSTIFGPTCDSVDTVLTDCKLPELQVNDLLVFYNMGAYTSSAATKFNGFNFDFSTYLMHKSPN